MRNCLFTIAFLFFTSLLPVLGFATRVTSRNIADLAIDRQMPLIEGLGNYHRKVTTDSPRAQRYFDQGLAFLYGFNHEAALSSFRAAGFADPNCAMAYWGVAAALGPEINNPNIPLDDARIANMAIATARSVWGKATPVEKGLIDAIAKRYSKNEADDPLKCDRNYAAALLELGKTFPGDPDVSALGAEALMIVQCKARVKDRRNPEPKREIATILERVLKNCPDHPFALHLWIHAMDHLRQPERARIESDRLRELAPGIGHLMHMPSHVDIRLGRWQDAVVANERAVAADHVFRRAAPQRGSHSVYMAHNEHMLIYAAMMQGQRKKAMRAAEAALGLIPDLEALPDPGTYDVFKSMPYEILMRFGQWDAILAEPEPGFSFPFSRAIRHFSRGTAFTAKRNVLDARIEQQDFLKARKRVPQTLLFRFYRVVPSLDVAERMLAGEILYREGKVADAVAALRAAVACEDNLDYADPPLWIQPVRHALGATLMDAGRFAEAEAVYREDLKKHPENGWALYGLSRSLQMQDKKSEAALVRARFEKAWQYADFKLKSSCCCLPLATRDGSSEESKKVVGR
jgi:tetratricopeptide (TPR) repeat protein